MAAASAGDSDWQELLRELEFHPARGTEFERIRCLRAVRALEVRNLEEAEVALAQTPSQPIIANLWVQDAALLGCPLVEGAELHAVWWWVSTGRA